MSWALRRQFQYLSGIFIIFVLIVAWFLYPLLTKAPSCFDGIKNGSENGVDCGGSCSIVCSDSASLPIVLWSRAFPIIGNNYNLIAYVENQNKEFAVQNVSYEFKIYDTNNRLIGFRDGSTFIPPNQSIAIFEPRFYAGETKAHSVSFDFTSPITWVKKSPIAQLLPLRVSNINFSIENDIPTLTAKIRNDSVYDIPEFDIVAILYDVNHNAINVSKTHKDELKSNTDSLLLFTWPENLAANPTTQEIFVQINPFSLTF